MPCSAAGRPSGICVRPPPQVAANNTECIQAPPVWRVPIDRRTLSSHMSFASLHAALRRGAAPPGKGTPAFAPSG